MFGFSRSTLIACTVTAFAVTSAIYSVGAQATGPSKSQARIAAELASPVSPRTLAAINPASTDGCLIINERKINADGSADVTSFRICE
ncbi:MAG: hypothetical protein ACRCYS_04830 [Beijerinckiaceae bacterium]